MQINELHDQKAWNELLLFQPTQAPAETGQVGIFLQSFEWGEFQKAVGRHVYRYRAQDGIAQVIELPLPLGKKYWFIPRGILMKGLEEEARKRGVLFVRFEPPQQLHVTRYTLHVTRPVSPTQTLLVDLVKSEDELLAGMHEKTRYNVRLALRKSVRVDSSQSTVHSFESFWKMMQETAKRDKFHTHPREYYEKMLQVCCRDLPPPPPTPLNLPSGRGEKPPRAGGEIKTISSPFQGEVRRGFGQRHDKFFVRLHIAYHGTTPLAAAIVGYFGDTATYLHGCSSYEHRALMGPYALHWHIMQEAKKADYRIYDFWGTTARKHAKGIARFKTGFGGQVVDYPGAFDLPLNRFWYTVYRLGRKILTR